MIAYIKGEIISIKEEKIIVECGNIGYNIFVPMSVLPNLPGVGEEAKIFTYMNVKEDSMTLFGFLTEDDLDMFKMLITVNGIGPKAALAILSALTVTDLRIAIATDDAKAIAKSPGIGSKSAQKIILELKGKVDLEESIKAFSSSGEAVQVNTDDDRGEAVQALVALGYSNTEALKAVRQVTDDVTGVDGIIKAALKKLF